MEQPRRVARDDGPTAELRTQTYDKVPGEARWAWRHVDHVKALHVHVYTQIELAAEFAVHGPRVAGLLEASPADRFRITGHCLTTGGTVGEWIWERSQETGRWMPAAPPWMVWDDKLRVAALEKQAAKRSAHPRPHPGSGTTQEVPLPVTG